VVSNNNFTPANRVIEVGDTVGWNFTEGTHTTTGPDWDSGNHSSGNYFHTFDTVGIFNYICNIHGPSMSGSITVNEPDP
jgi:plastocyanin